MSLCQLIKGTDPFFLTNSGHNYHFLFYVWKSILRYLGNVSQNIRGLRVPEPPPQMGANIYIYNCMYHIIIVIISKNIS